MARGPRVLLWTGGITAVLLLLGGVGWSYLTEREDPPETSDYALDLVEVRRLAAEPHGRRAHTVHSLLVARTSMPRAAIFAGASFEAHPMVHQVFQLVFPDSTLLIDSGFGPAGFETGGRGGSLTEGAIERVRSAIESARTVVITHEHGDHIGGIAEHPEPDALVGSVALSAAQLGSTEWLDGAGFPQSLREQLRPLRDEHYHAVAPGVVLIAAPGHAPGAQIVYVGLANGRELLFLGDVVWHMDAIRNLHYRPRLITDLFLGEDRRAVLHQIRRLHELMREQPRLRFVVSHDEEQRQELLAEGWLQDGLAP